MAVSLESIKQYLNTPLIGIVVDYWSFVHLFTGILFGAILARKNKGWLLTLAALTVYEIIENTLLLGIFTKEPFVNILADITIGMAGFFIARFYVLNLHEQESMVGAKFRFTGIKEAYLKKPGKIRYTG